jgi:hypothetical protein
MDINTVISALAAMAFSLLLEYFPGFSDWYNALENKWQRLIAFGSIVVAALVGFGVSCTQFTIPGIDTSSVSCDTGGANALVQGVINLFVAAVTSQSTYLLARKSTKDSSKPVAPKPA